jgi:hypothetical protein
MEILGLELSLFWVHAATAIASASTVFLGFKFGEFRLKPCIVPLELAFTPARAHRVLELWQAPGIVLARKNLHLDFWFILSYVPLFMGLTLMAAHFATPCWQPLARWLVAGAVVAGLCDIIENFCLMRILDEWTRTSEGAEPRLSAGSPLIAGIAASIKFILLALCLLFVLVLAAVPWDRPG